MHEKNRIDGSNCSELGLHEAAVPIENATDNVGQLCDSFGPFLLLISGAGGGAVSKPNLLQPFLGRVEYDVISQPRRFHLKDDEVYRVVQDCIYLKGVAGAITSFERRTQSRDQARVIREYLMQDAAP